MTSTATTRQHRRRVRKACDVVAACAIGGAVGVLTVGALLHTGSDRATIAAPRPSSVAGSSISAISSDVELASPLEVISIDPPAGILPAEVLAAEPVVRAVPVAKLPTAVAPPATPAAPPAQSAAPTPAPRPIIGPSAEGGLALRLGPIDAAVGRGLVATSAH